MTDVLPAPGVLKNPFLRAAASIETLSEHPLAEAVMNYAKEKEIVPQKAENLSATAGQGIEADVNGKHILGGNLKMMQERKINRRLRRTGSSACGTGQNTAVLCGGRKTPRHPRSG